MNPQDTSLLNGLNRLNQGDMRPGYTSLYQCPSGLEEYILGKIIESHGLSCLYISPTSKGIGHLQSWLSFYAPHIPCLSFPPFEQEPYDRLSPKGTILAQRAHTLLRVIELKKKGIPFVLSTTFEALVQKMPPPSFFEGRSFTLEQGSTYSFDGFKNFLNNEGYRRVDVVQESPEYAMRGDIIDISSPGSPHPIRLDFFGETLQRLTPFDPITQRRLGPSIDKISITPTHEIRLDQASISHFRKNYRNFFGAKSAEDSFYETISQGIPAPGYEYWAPLFHEHMVGLWEYLPSFFLALPDHHNLVLSSVYERIHDHYHSRCQNLALAPKEKSLFHEEIYRPLPPDTLYWRDTTLTALFESHPSLLFTKSYPPHELPDHPCLNMEASPLASWPTVRNTLKINTSTSETTFPKELCHFITTHLLTDKPLILAVSSSWAQNYFLKMFQEYGVPSPLPIEDFSQIVSQKTPFYIARLPLEEGFTSDLCAYITEKDLLGHRLQSQRVSKSSTDKLLETFESFSPGDLVVHEHHGIGRFEKLVPLTVGGMSHDYLELTYAQNDRLFVPVENLDVLSRYGSPGEDHLLDKLGSSQWARRKEKLKEKIQETAKKLMHIAALRHKSTAPCFTVPEEAYDNFCDRFPYEETPDQLRTAQEVREDFKTGVPMDRLLCGDVGFGKTEIALRAAFITLFNGYQVALLSPTTLLAHQHFETFRQRFQGLGFRIEELSRLIPTAQSQKIRKAVLLGQVNCLISTHSALSKSLTFHKLGLLIIDEEQHFGVEQKERLKEKFPGLHILTLSATPIPRTLQMALSGVRDLSLITTPPPDRLSVKTTVMPYDSLIVKEALMREYYRGGQSFFVTPRIDDLSRLTRHLGELVPELRVGVAHGQLSPKDLESVMAGFYNRTFDILLATNIIESGLDVPTANTLIVGKSDCFGLSQLYQLRGRIGRSKKRGFAYLTYEKGKTLTKDAEKRLDVFNHLDKLGGGFTIASHDMDIRGAGNLIGEEQSGHIKEVGIELYQHLLKEAIESLNQNFPIEETLVNTLTAQIIWNIPIFIPDTYVSSLDTRLSLYRRISRIKTTQEIHQMSEELTDRFGTVPESVTNLFRVVELKRIAEKAHVEKIDIGEKAIVFSFSKNLFPNPSGLIDILTQSKGGLVLRPDHKLVYKKGWATPSQKIENLKDILLTLEGLCI